MNYILILLFIFVGQNDATDDNDKWQKIRNIDGSFDINIGAGYAVGTDHSSPPNGSSNISLTKNYYSNPPKSSVVPNTTLRNPRILTNFTPQIGSPFSELINKTKVKSDISDATHKDYYSAAPSNIHSYSSASFLKPSEDFKQPNLVDFKQVLEKIESKKPFSKVHQVIKVPAIYEIHLQSDKDDDITENRINVNPTGDLFWKNYYENKPNISTKYSDEYSKWLETNNMQRQESFSKDGEKYYDFSDTPIVTYENYLEQSPHNNKEPEKLEESEILQPIISHHYNNIVNSPSTYRSDSEVKENYNFFSKPPWQSQDFPYNKKQLGANNLKKPTFHNSYSVYEPKTTTKPFLEISNNFNLGNKNPFNQAIAEDDKPQALHEVPPPLFGKHSHTKYFEIQKVSQTVSHPKVLPSPSPFKDHTKVKLNKLSSPTNKHKFSNGLWDAKLNYSPTKKEKLVKPEVVPSSNHFSSYIKGNQNLIYGTKSGRVLTPYEINIPVTPGSTMVTVPEKPDSMAQNSKPSLQYSARIRSNPYPANLERPDVVNYKHNTYHQPIQQNLKIVNEHVNSKSNKNVQHPQNGYQKDRSIKTQNVKQNIQNFDAGTGNTKHYLTSEEPENLTRKFSSPFHDLVPMPYQTQKSITNVESTTQSNNVDLLSGISSTTTKYENNDQSQVEKKDGKKDENLGVFGTAPTFHSEAGSRRRTFNINYNMGLLNGLTKNRFHHEYVKNSDNTRLHYQGKDKGADYVIYITRKAMD